MTPLRRRMIEDIRVRNLAPNTQRAYLQQVHAFAEHFGRSPDLLGPERQFEWFAWQIN
jgi:integrase/recombinase XerD